MIKCSVVGATGYTGVELIKILLRHPEAEISVLTTRQSEPIPVHQLVPSLPFDNAFTVRQYSVGEICKKSDVVFLCLPHTEAMEAADDYHKAGKVVIDLSADLRLKNWKTYEHWYGVKHVRRHLLKKAVYGLSEIYRDEIHQADLISNPGCYPTGSTLGLYPFLQQKLIESDSLIIDAKSGVSGAGKKLTQATQFCELDQNFYAYKVGRHQHTPEINQTLSQAAGRPVAVTFTAHLLPVSRGILATIYARIKKGVRASRIRKALSEFYEAEPFIRIKPEGSFPSIKEVQNTNFCDIGVEVDEKNGRLIIVTAIDNLLKGASGQAVQNMNIRFGLSETQGLSAW